MFKQDNIKIFTSLDANVFTDRGTRCPFQPSELDLVATVGGRWRAWEVSLIRESDAPVDRGGLTQSYYALMLRWYFDLPWLTRAAPRGEATAYATSWRRTHRRYPRAGQVPSQSASLRHVSATS